MTDPLSMKVFKSPQYLIHDESYEVFGVSIASSGKVTSRAMRQLLKGHQKAFAPGTRLATQKRSVKSKNVVRKYTYKPPHRRYGSMAVQDKT